MRATKFCKTCNADTERYENYKCKPCCARRDREYRIAPREARPVVEHTRPGVHLEGSLHGKIRGGQGAIRPDVRRGCSMS